jgi:hypothetical protein
LCIHSAQHTIAFGHYPLCNVGNIKVMYRHTCAIARDYRSPQALHGTYSASEPDREATLIEQQMAMLQSTQGHADTWTHPVHMRRHPNTLSKLTLSIPLPRPHLQQHVGQLCARHI